MADVPLPIVDHRDGRYSLIDPEARIILDRVGLDEVVEYLRDRHSDLYPPPTSGEVWEAAWEAAHPPPEPSIDLGLGGPTILSLKLDMDTGLLRVRRDDEVIAEDITLTQFSEALRR